MLIRRYQPEDTDALLRLWEEASRLAHPFLEEPFFDSERANIVEVYLPAAETWVAESGQRLAGFVSLLGTEIGGLFVDAGFHRQGTGRALVEHVRGLHGTLELDVFRENRIGRAFYERCGFHEVGRSVHARTGHELIRLQLSRSHTGAGGEA